MLNVKIPIINFKVNEFDHLSWFMRQWGRSHCRAISYEHHDLPFEADRGISVKFKAWVQVIGVDTF